MHRSIRQAMPSSWRCMRPSPRWRGASTRRASCRRISRPGSGSTRRSTVSGRSGMLKHVTIDGRDAVVAYVDSDFNPVEPERASMMRITWDNGDAMWAEPRLFESRRQNDFDPNQPRDPHGRWAFAGGGPAGEKWQSLAQSALEEWKKEHPSIEAKTVKLRRDLDAAMAEAEKYTSYKDWYDDHRPLAKELFGEDEPVFEKFLAAASVQSAGAVNVEKAIQAYAHWKLGGSFAAEDFPHVVPAERIQYEHIAAMEELTGPKIVAFEKALKGDWDQVPADRWMKRLLFEHPRTGGESGKTPSQAEVTKAIVTAIAKKMDWKPAQVQAVLWAVA